MEGNTFEIGSRKAKGRILNNHGGGTQTERTEPRGTKLLKDVPERICSYENVYMKAYQCCHSFPFLFQCVAAKVGECSKQDIHFISRPPGHPSTLEGSVAAKGNTLHTLLLWGRQKRSVSDLALNHDVSQNSECNVLFGIKLLHCLAPHWRIYSVIKTVRSAQNEFIFQALILLELKLIYTDEFGTKLMS